MAKFNVAISIGDLFDRIKKCETKEQRKEWLRREDSIALRTMLRLNFDDNIRFDIPEGFPPIYKNKNDILDHGETTLKVSIKKFYMFVASSTPTLRQSKREAIFCQMLEQLDMREANYLVACKDKKLNIGLTAKLVNEVFPNLIPNITAEEEESVVKSVEELPSEVPSEAPIRPTKEELIKAYSAKGMSKVGLARMFGVSVTTLDRWFKKFDIKTKK